MRGALIRPVVIAAGGTGGHFFPAEALAAELVRRGRRVALMTDRRSGALASPVFEGRECFVLQGSGIAGRGALRGVQAAGSISLGAFQARSILARLHAGVVVGFGGYPCVAPVLGARMIGVTGKPRPAILLHEQNAVLGRANRGLARFCDQLALSVPVTRHAGGRTAVAVTGNPVRPAIAALAGHGYAPPADGLIRLLVLGGSLGARVLSDVVPAALAALPDDVRGRLSVVQQCRAEDLTRVRAAYDGARIVCELSPFFADVAAHLEAAHLVIARAGASTVAELAAAGRPALLVPLPGAIDDHQRANAEALAHGGAAVVMAQPGFTPAALASQLSLLGEPARLAAMAAAAAASARIDAAQKLADLVETHMPTEMMA